VLSNADLHTEKLNISCCSDNVNGWRRLLAALSATAFVALVL
jgi:hypothetical protein